MGIIYQIECLETGLVYIGKTTQSLKKRFILHKSNFKNRYDNCSCSLIFEKGFAFASIIEIVEDETKLHEREFYYIQNTNCVNVHDGRSFDEEYMKDYRKEWYEANRKRILEKITCPCGLTIAKCHKARHERSQTHLAWLATQP